MATSPTPPGLFLPLLRTRSIPKCLGTKPDARGETPAGSLIVHRLLLLAALEGVVVQQLLDEVDVGEQHSSAAVPAKPEGIEGVTLRVVDLQELEVLVVLVADDLAASEAAHRDDHRAPLSRASTP
eukprot:CAMPEP_0118818476 /NCGR_PEP_ID=MMETSP1162-20130426/6203_1 /TAXON_ID=33656 /ORGANISM="Phaeocystis Sp, Strain CCMP2710" /LENGTH=125 /DNA_ID=CAMNT_0006748683 /DNA_START=170 /DNA_END=544 /DNA_ORIENTATION=+